MVTVLHSRPWADVAADVVGCRGHHRRRATRARSKSTAAAAAARAAASAIGVPVTNRVVSTATASSFLNMAGTMGK
jgi:hypothetical protein